MFPNPILCCLKITPPLEPNFIRIAKTIKTGINKTIAIIEIKRSRILLIVFCQEGIISGLTEIRRAPKIEFIFTDPVRILYMSAITFISTFRFAKSFIIWFVFCKSSDSVAIITSSISKSSIILLI
ncbi:MAG: Uncharacterised protein [Crocinitomicaceae bacterium]|nr:MAG: Uncharacterised protein [Crocinitomicaceae bacterium]